MSNADVVNEDLSPKAHYGRVHDPRLSADEMDNRRKENIAYEYLCHLEEAKVWIEACIGETLPPTTELEEGLRNGVYLAKLGHFMAPDVILVKKIYDRDQSRFQVRGLHFRHTDNINHWLKGLETVGHPKIFYPETTDIYDRKNMPRVIYCIHALSLYLFKLGKAPQIQDLYGKIKFTDEEISAMRKELEKYGIQMPAFSKIGGILANEMPVDEAALHAAVIAINEAVDRQVAEDTMTSLQNPAAHLCNMNLDLADTYQVVLCEAKNTKLEIARNKSMDPDSSYIPDVYDEILTQAELQGNINLVNTHHALGQVSAAVEKRSATCLLSTLRLSVLSLRDVRDSSRDLYLEKLVHVRNTQRMNNNEEGSVISKETVQAVIREANSEGDFVNQRERAVKLINEALDNNDSDAVLTGLQNPDAQLPSVQNFAGLLYKEELRNMKCEKQSSLDYEELFKGVKVLSAIAAVNKAVDTRDRQLMSGALQSEEACLFSLDITNSEKYLQALGTAKVEKHKKGADLLTHFEVQQCINQVNYQTQEESNQVQAISRINEAVDQGEQLDVLSALQQPAACLGDVEECSASFYLQFLLTQKQQKAAELNDPTAVLWLQDIQTCVNMANSMVDDAHQLSVGIAAINIAIETEDKDNLMNCLQNPPACLHSVTPQCSSQYLRSLARFKAQKAAAGEGGSGWMMNRSKDGYKVYFNTNTLECAFERPDGVKKDYSLLTREEIQNCLSEVTAAYDRQLLFKANEKFIVMVQARIRGYLARRQYQHKVQFMYTQLPAVLKIQAWWRMVLVRRKYVHRLKYLYDQQHATTAIQAAVRMQQERRKYQNRLRYFKKHTAAVIKIQAFMRSNWAKKDYKALVHGHNPLLSVIRKFVHLLDLGDLDYSEEIELERLRQQVVTEIRSNQQLENDLNMMDIKIGLLVKNRITLQDVISQHKTLKRYRDSTSTLSIGGASGLKALSKQSRERLEAYQHLFYMLQTHPAYLARLIFEMPQSKTTKFMESVILTLYNYASNQREEYLLLKLFKTALGEEIRSKVDRMSDIVTGNPLVVKLIVSFNRSARGHSALRELLNPLVHGIIDDRNLQINTNPVDVYKQWVNQMETQTGKASGLPYDVNPEQALQHQEVRDQIEQSVLVLEKATETFLAKILNSVDSIPYGMRYMAKVLRNSLNDKFPDAPEKDVLKIVGNLIYYRYINSAIVAPDAFDIIDTGPNKSLTNDQRRNLGSVAKILQFAASNKGFGGDSSHLASMNKYIIDAHIRFKKYFNEICRVEEPEVEFNMDQYSDVTRVTKPVIYISIAELIDTHKLLLDHQDTITQDAADCLHELLDDLGEVPDVESLIGDAGSEDSHTNRAQLAKTEISLTLSNKFEVPEEDQSDLKSLLICTKRMVVDVIRCQRSGENLTQVLQIPCSPAEEGRHAALIMKREKNDQRALVKQAKLVRQQSMAGDMRLPLQQMKQKIAKSLAVLENSGLTSHTDQHQAIINAIVKDIRTQRMYRQTRKQEMMRLKVTLQSLEKKRAFYEEQIDYYNQYVKTCLDNLSTKGKKSGKHMKKPGPRVKGSMKYSAAKLHEKGVVLEIEELPSNQFKNVLFEISSTDVAGVFDVNAKFMGVNMEKVELIFQDLLQLQYEGVSVMKMYKAKINVNLLIFLLNKKFYGK